MAFNCFAMLWNLGQAECDEIDQKLDLQRVNNSLFIFDRWATLKDALVEKRSKLGESQNLQQFIRDVDDIEGWISEKMQTALEESYKDPANIQVSIYIIGFIIIIIITIF